MEELLGKIQKLQDQFANRAAKATLGNKSAGVESRQLTIELGKLFKEWRKISIPKK